MVSPYVRKNVPKVLNEMLFLCMLSYSKRSYDTGKMYTSDMRAAQTQGRRDWWMIRRRRKGHIPADQYPYGYCLSKCRTPE